MRKPLALLVLLSSVWVAGDVSAAPRSCGSRGRFSALEAIALTSDQRLICFNERRPAAARDIGPVTGLNMSEMLVGIDFRPANGKLYGLGNAGGIYVIDPLTAVATLQSTVSVPLMGMSFGVDFNPVPDRLRIVSDAGQNLRVDVDSGMAMMDTALSAMGMPVLGVTGIAYTNNDADPNTGTVLYDLAMLTDQLMIQSPPNAGTLNPVGNLVFDAAMDTGFDVFSDKLVGTSVRVKALATLPFAGGSQVFQIDLTTGRAALRGSFSSTNLVIGLAIPLIQGR